MKKINLISLAIFIFTSILLSSNSENLKPEGIISVQKFLEAKQIEYKNSVKIMNQLMLKNIKS